MGGGIGRANDNETKSERTMAFFASLALGGVVENYLSCRRNQNLAHEAPPIRAMMNPGSSRRKLLDTEIFSATIDNRRRSFAGGGDLGPPGSFCEAMLWRIGILSSR